LAAALYMSKDMWFMIYFFFYFY